MRFRQAVRNSDEFAEPVRFKYPDPIGGVLEAVVPHRPLTHYRLNPFRNTYQILLNTPGRGQRSSRLNDVTCLR